MTDWGRCKRCKGEGQIIVENSDGTKYVADCSACSGTGRASDGITYYERFVI